jgi:hypothetical protein
MTLGGAVLAAGVLVWVTWGVLRPSGHPFWSWIGVLGVALTVVGSMSLIGGFLMPREQSEESQVTQRQSLTSGSNSTNSQAGRDSLQAGRDLVVKQSPRKRDDDS